EIQVTALLLFDLCVGGPKSRNHQRNELRRRRTSRQRIRLWKEVTLEILCCRIEIVHESGVARRRDEVVGFAEPLRLINRRHLTDRESFGERNRVRIDIASGNLVDHLYDAHRPIEPIFTRLQYARSSRPQERGSKRPLVGDDPGIDQATTNPGCAGPGRDIDELLRLRKALIRLLYAVPRVKAKGRRSDSNYKNQDRERDEEPLQMAEPLG